MAPAAERVAITQLPTAEQEFYDSQAAAGMRNEASTSHIYFKDLKLLAHDEDSEDDEHEAEGEGEGGPGPTGGEQAGCVETQPSTSYASLDRLGSGVLYFDGPPHQAGNRQRARGSAGIGAGGG